VIIFGLDPATHCGWAVFKDGDPVACGTWTLGRVGWEVGARIEALALELDQLRLACGPPEYLFYEQCFGARRSAELQHGLIGYIRYWCSRLCVPCEGLNGSSVKLSFAGSGKASKDTMLAEARRRWPHLDIPDDNAADALAVGVTGLERMNNA